MSYTKRIAKATFTEADLDKAIERLVTAALESAADDADYYDDPWPPSRHELRDILAAAVERFIYGIGYDRWEDGVDRVTVDPIATTWRLARLLEVFDADEMMERIAPRLRQMADAQVTE